MEPCLLLDGGGVRPRCAFSCLSTTLWAARKIEVSFLLSHNDVRFFRAPRLYFFCGGSQEHLLGPLMKSLKVDASVGLLSTKVSLLHFLLHFSQ